MNLKTIPILIISHQLLQHLVILGHAPPQDLLLVAPEAGHRLKYRI